MAEGMTAWQATEGNLVRSLAAWLYGAYDEAAKLLDDTGELATFSEVYATAPAPILAQMSDDPQHDPWRILRSGSPLLMLGLPAAGPLAMAFGGAEGLQSIQVPLALFCAEWLDLDSGKLNAPRTAKQLINATGKVTRLLQWRDGCCPIWDFALSPPESNRIGTAVIEPLGPPVLRQDQSRADWTLRVTWHRQSDCAANAAN